MSRFHILVLLAGCAVGPAYHRPSVALPVAFKEWKLATPTDALPRGPWWTMFHDAELDALEARVEVGNQNIAIAIDNFLVAAAQIRAARSAYYPTVVLTPSATYSRGGGGAFARNSTTTTTTPTGTGTTTTTTGTGTGTTTTTTANPGSTATAVATSSVGRIASYALPVEVSWAPDLFGRVRNTVHQRAYTAQARAADLENVRLLQHSTLAQTYFSLRGQDSLIALLEQTVAANQDIVKITQASYKLGISNEADLLQAQLTLQTYRVQLTNAGVARAQYEHAIATLLGVPASSFSLPRRPLTTRPPTIPIATPSHLLERRPDIASAERQVAAANAAIGIAHAAYFPLLTLSANGGVASTSLEKLLSWPSRFWSLGANLAQTIFDGGLRRANTDVAIAAYDATVATYRQTVLTAFQQVEDQLAELRIVGFAIEQQTEAVRLAQRAYEIGRARYQTGIDPYVTMLSRQVALYEAQQTLISFEIQRMTSSVLLIQYLGGGWSASELPSPGAATQASPR